MWYFIGNHGSGCTLGSDVQLTCIDIYGFRFCGSFLSDLFSSCRSVHSLMIASMCFRVCLDGSFLMILVSSVFDSIRWGDFWCLGDVVIKLDRVGCAL